jgi:hypothetical protein
MAGWSAPISAAAFPSSLAFSNSRARAPTLTTQSVLTLLQLAQHDLHELLDFGAGVITERWNRVIRIEPTSI